MAEGQDNDIMETNEPPAPLPLLTWRDGAIPLLAIALAWLFWTCFSLEGPDFPHLGVLALVVLHFAAVLTVLGRRARLNAGSLFSTAAALALAVSCALYASDVFLVMNCFAILFTAALATFSLSGQLSPGRPSAIWQTVLLSCAAFFSCLGRPFRALGRVLRKDKRRMGQGALAVLIAVPVLGAVLWLLSSADAVFGSLLPRLETELLPERLIWRALRVLILALFLASALYFLRQDVPAPAEKPEKERRAALFLPVTAALDIVYIIFCIIQIKYLFGGASDAAMSGGWAEYARSGFFQLITITFINLALCLLATDKKRFASHGGKLLRALLGLLLVLTAVILASAFWRMQLYILAFGMSVLRLLTLWAMAVICFGLLAAGRKLARPGFGFFRAAGGFALALWCLLCLAGPCSMIARYNVSGYVSGALEQLDTDYLRRLGPDVLPALAPLRQTGPDGQAALDELTRQFQARPDDLPWAQQSLSGRRAHP